MCIRDRVYAQHYCITKVHSYCIRADYLFVFTGMAKNSKVVFKTYSPAQGMLLPPSLEELIAKNHPVRVVNEVIESLNLELLEKAYVGGGTSSYHPKMLLKILVYGYVTNIYSSRKLEAAAKEN